MLSSYLTLMVIPDKNGHVLRFRLTAFNLKLFKTIAVLLFFATVGILIDYTYILMKHSGQKELEQQLYYQKFLINQKHQELTMLANSLSHFEQFDHKLRIISGLQDSLRPGSNLLETSTQPTSQVIKTAAINIQTDINNRLVSFFQLQAYLQEMQVRLQRTPSIAPAKGYMSSAFGVRHDPITKHKKMHQGVDYSNAHYTPRRLELTMAMIS